MSWPCLCMAEGRGEERVVVGRIVGIDSGGVGTVATARTIPTVPALTNSAIWRLRAPLDIDQFEFHRHHWAIKERDLLGVMAAAGVALQPDDLATFSKLPLPAPDRQTLLLAKNRVGDWGHTEITDLLLEAGVQDLAAPATISRRDRANAILTYIFEHPSSTTAEGFTALGILRPQSWCCPRGGTAAREAYDRRTSRSESDHSDGTALLQPSLRRPWQQHSSSRFDS